MRRPGPAVIAAIVVGVVGVVGAVGAVGVIGWPRLAAGEPDARRKATPAKVTKAASEAFADASEADQRGDLRSALGLYQKAFAIAPHPATSYNTADVLRRLGQITAALKSYETYLALAPAAGDRKEVEALIATLARTPGTLVITTYAVTDPRAIDLKRAYVLADGEVVVKPGVTPTTMAGTAQPGIPLELRAGKYVIDVVTEISYGVRECEVTPGERATCVVYAPPRIDGSVVLSGSDSSLRVVTDRTSHNRGVIRERLELAAGRTKLMVRDRQYECPALVVDVPRSGDVGYTFLATREYDRLERCRSLAIKHHRLRFEP